VLTYIARRILYSIPVLLLASFLTFWAVRLATNPLAQYKVPGSHRTPQETARLIAQKRHQLHLDENIVFQWARWLGGVLHGDWGQSEVSHESVWSMITRALWPTAQLLFWGTLVSIVIAIAVGVYSAVKQYSVGDHALTTLSYIGIAMPPFWFGLLAIGLLTTWPVTHWHLDQPIFYSVGLHSTGQSGFNMDYVRHLVLPVATLAVTSVAAWSRFQRASMLDVLNADYVRTARAKGVPRRKVIWKHAFRNALIPFVTVVALDTAFLIGGLIITEVIFAIHGMGFLFIDAMSAGDAPVLLAWFFVTALAVIIMNLLTDLAYGLLDPRIRTS
jgi:peptide/nickel transport system permease protein